MRKPPLLFDWSIVGPASGDALRKLDPRLIVRHAVMFVTMSGAIPSIIGVYTAIEDRALIAQTALWLCFTVLFANFAQAVPHGRGKAQAESLRKAPRQTIARLLRSDREEKAPVTQLQKDAYVVCGTGDIIPADGDIVEGIASADEAAITGKSAPVICESGGDRRPVTGGATAISDRIAEGGVRWRPIDFAEK